MTTAGDAIGDEVASQHAPLGVVPAGVALLLWRYDTDRLSPNSLPDGGPDLATPATGGAPGEKSAAPIRTSSPE